jgi:membrane protease YdiL (CAAX protease family)
MRAYLMTEVLEISGKPWLAVVISVAVQSSIHIYQGWNNVFILSATFALFALYFAKTRRAMPVIAAHYLIDIWSFWRYFAHSH